MASKSKLKDDHTLEYRSRDIDHGYAWVTMGIVTINWITCGIYFGSYSVLYDEYITVFNATGAQVGFIISIYCLCLFGAGMFSNYIAGKCSAKGTGIVSSVFSAITFFIAAFSPNLIILGLCYAFTGIGVGLTLVAVSSNLQQHFDRRRSIASGFTSSGASFSILIGPLMTRILVDTYGWRGTLLFITGIGMQNIWLCSLLRPVDIPTLPASETNSKSSESSETNSSSERSISKCFRALFDPDVLCDLRFIIYGIATLCFNFGIVCGSLQIVNKAMKDNISKKAAALIPALSGFLSIFWCPLSGLVITACQLKRIPIFGVACLGMGLFYCCVGLFSTFWTLVLFMGLGSLCNATARINIHPVAIDIMGIEKVTSVIGALGIPTALGQLLAGSLSGWLYDVTGSFNVSFYAAGISELIAGVLILSILIIKKKKSTVLEINQQLTLQDESYSEKHYQNGQLTIVSQAEKLKRASEKSELGSAWSLVGI